MTADDIRARLEVVSAAIFAQVQPSNPEPVCWLDTDAGSSLCWDCAVLERGKEFDLGVPLTPHRYFRTELEEEFYRGIDGGYHGQMPHDTPEWCSCCDKGLAYELTDYGLSEEAHGWAEAEITAFTSYDAYALDRLIIGIYPEGSEESLTTAVTILDVAEKIAAFLDSTREVTT